MWLGTGPALAQSAVPTRDQIPPAPAPTTEKPTATVREGGAFQPGPCALDKSTETIAINEIKFTAVGGGDLPAELARMLTGISTKSEAQPVRVVCDLRDEANGRLRAARYVAAVQIPAQRIDTGVLRLEVVTGRIVDVRVRGDGGPFNEVLKSRIDALKTMSPLNAAEAERLLMLVNDIPGLNVQLGLSPNIESRVPGELIGDLEVTYRRASVYANVQNYNSTLLGRETAYLRAEYYSLLGLNDRAFIAGSSTFDFKEQRIAQFGEEIGLGSNGDRLSFTGTVAYSRPTLDTLDLRTLTLIANLEYTRPLVRSVSTKIEAAAGFEWAQQRTKVFGNSGGLPLNRDRIATIYLRLNADKRKIGLDGAQDYALGGSLEVRKGLGILGATKTGTVVDGYSPTRFTGSAVATVVRGQINGALNLGPVFELGTTLKGQWSNKALLNYDQFSIGNLTMVRGYDPGANTGDRAIGGAHELRLNHQLNQDISAQVYGFYDWTHIWNLDPTSTERSRTLRSYGAGARVSLAQGVRLDLTYAHPRDPALLTGAVIKPPPGRFMFSLTAQLLPFGARR